MMKAILAGALLLVFGGCTDSMIITRPVQDEPSLLVGLAHYQDPGKLGLVQHNHPMEWADADLHSILARLLIQERGGIMDPFQQPQVVFSADDIIHLTPALLETFSVARPSDWVVFALWGSSQNSQALEVTSGGMFLQDQRLHIILSNHRERVSSEREGITGIRRNPFRSLRDIKQGKLTFDPTRYMIDSRNNWMAGGYESPASELILDLKAILATDRLSTLGTLEKYTAAENSRTSSISASSTESDVGMLKEEISNLKEELSRLQRQITQQAD